MAVQTPHREPAPVVFLGPSLSHEEARRRSRMAIEVRPPVQRGDIERLDPAVQTTCIVDGVFLMEHAVTAREILQALRKGTRVVGAASMGALRAAELAPYGMEGVGEIYRMYANREIASDAEVALAFDPITLRPTSEPLVNVRRLLRYALEAEVLTSTEASTVLELARRTHFSLLTYPMLFREAAASLGDERVARLRAFHGTHLADLDAKRSDALAAIAYLNGES
jgi:TfuA protein